jgi:glyoxylase-like metal-dependent hydrolase (beta-lactamase superfamily II)
MFSKLVVILVGITFCAAAAANAPLQNTQAPGWWRMRLGHFEITALSDGSSPLPAGHVLTHIEPNVTAAALRGAFLSDLVETSINAYLINTGSRLVLIDTGAGSSLGPRHGKLLANLQAAGYSPGQVDEIYITHMHGDHVGGLVAANQLVFPNATVRASRQDADFWLSKEKMAAAPEAMRPQFQQAMRAISPYASAGKFKPFDGQVALVPGITARPAGGHTPGHTVYMIESDGQKLLVMGDLVHIAAVQFANPSATVQFDTDSEAAASTRKAIFEEASAQEYWIAGAHLSFPGIGHIRVSEVHYAFVPANYTSAP